VRAIYGLHKKGAKAPLIDGMIKDQSHTINVSLYGRKFAG
jgi:hypothetical protein